MSDGKLYTILLTLALAVPANATTFRVDVNSTAQNPNGSTWPLAFQHLQDALAVATESDEI